VKTKEQKARSLEPIEGGEEPLQVRYGHRKNHGNAEIVKTMESKNQNSKTNGQDCQATENSKLYESKGRKAMDLKQ
jgi:hypothetical protein